MNNKISKVKSQKSKLNQENVQTTSFSYGVKKIFVLVFAVAILVVTIVAIAFDGFNKDSIKKSVFQSSHKSTDQNEGGLDKIQHPLSIEYMREQNYPGSDLVIEQELPDKSNYHQYIASYKSEGLKIYGLLTITTSNTDGRGKPSAGDDKLIRVNPKIFR